MGVTVASAIYTAAAAGSEQQRSNVKTEMGKDEFLKLLITELRYQDALDPMQDREFISQMAQFSSLEQIQNLNKTMESYLAYSNLNQGLSLQGREVTYQADGRETTGDVSALKQVEGNYVAVVEGEEVPLSKIILIK